MVVAKPPVARLSAECAEKRSGAVPIGHRRYSSENPAPPASLREPDGVELAGDKRGDAETGSLLAVKLPKTGRYTIWITPERGAGPYTLRIIDGD
jgi:hypothetical protein